MPNPARSVRRPLLQLVVLSCLAFGALPAGAAPPQAPASQAPASQAPAPQATASVDAAAADGEAAYRQLLEWRFTAAPVAVPEGGLRFARDTAAWHLERGELWPMEPTPSGAVTGLVFRGTGSFRIDIPDRVEREQLARLLGRPVAASFEMPFQEMVLRTSEPLLAELGVAAGAGAAFEPSAAARAVHERWLEKQWLDADARVVAGLRTPGDRYLRAEMEAGSGSGLGRVVYEWDGQRREEIELSRLEPNGFTESWLSLDRPEDRRPDGTPGGTARLPVDVTHVELEVDLTGRARALRSGRSRTPLRDAAVAARLDLVPRAGGATVLALELSPLAEVAAVEDEEGRELAFLRHHLGGRTRAIDKEIYDSSLVVLLDRPLVAGEARSLTVHYDLRMSNFAPGRGWYPGLEDGFNDQHTARMTISTRPKDHVRAVGRRLEEREEDGARTSVWQVDAPTKMVSFTYGHGFREEVLNVEGVPEVVSFGPQVAGVFGSRKMIRNVGADVVNSLRFFQWLLDSELPDERMLVTGIAAGHGQAFRGFLHLSEGTYAEETTGASELFRAHEVAHQWWGHEIGWESYRDQWLSEALAEYSAMLYVQTTMKNGERELEQILNVYTNLVTGSLRGAFSNYYRPWLLEMDMSEHGRLGPICLGYRASTARMPQGYFLQNYVRGPLVLHMLRSTLDAIAPGQDLFLKVLREFAAEYRGRQASTRDFVAVVNRVAPGDWTSFFDQWLCGTAIPTYTWSYEVEREGDGWVLDLAVRQDDVPPGFTVPVPLRIELADGRGATSVVLIDGPEKTVRVPLPQRPKEVELAPGHSVLARVKKVRR